MNTVYALVDPRNNEVRYVGLTSQTLQARLAIHMSNYASRGLVDWIDGFRDDGLKPKILPLELVADSDEASESELFWIAYMRSLGANLINVFHRYKRVVKPVNVAVGAETLTEINRLCIQYDYTNTQLITEALRAFQREQQPK